MDELEFYNGALTGAEIDNMIIYVYANTVTTGTTTVTSSKITAKHQVLAHYFNNEFGVYSDVTITTYDGYLTVAGTFGNNVTLSMLLGLHN